MFGGFPRKNVDAKAVEEECVRRSFTVMSRKHVKRKHHNIFQFFAFIIFLKDVLKRYFEKLSRHIHNRNPKEELGKVKTFHFYILSMSYLVVTDSDINPPARRVAFTSFGENSGGVAVIVPSVLNFAHMNPQK